MHLSAPNFLQALAVKGLIQTELAALKDELVKQYWLLNIDFYIFIYTYVHEMNQSTMGPWQLSDI